MTSASEWIEPLCRIEAAIRDSVVEACERQAMAELTRPDGDEGDTIYAIDRVGEQALVAAVEREIGALGPVVLVAEGFAGGSATLPPDARRADARWRLIVDPIDGTRGLMHQKRSGWVLAGVAPNRGEGTSLADIVVAVQTEIPLVKQHLCDVAWAERGRGATASRWNRLSTYSPDGTLPSPT
jgi:fructose-1,6-bisphosphatase/inositol monophosphatase family enzyme